MECQDSTLGTWVEGVLKQSLRSQYIEFCLVWIANGKTIEPELLKKTCLYASIVNRRRQQLRAHRSIDHSKTISIYI